MPYGLHISLFESPPRCAQARCLNFHLYAMSSPPCVSPGETSDDRPFRYEEHADTRESVQDERLECSTGTFIVTSACHNHILSPRPQFHRYSLIYYTSAHSQAQFQHYKVYADHTLIAAVHHGGCSFRVISIQYQLTATMRSNFRPVDKIQNLPDSPSPELSGVYSPYRLRVDDVASHTEQPRRCSSKSPAMARSSGFMTHPLYQLARARRMVTNTTFGAMTSRGISD